MIIKLNIARDFSPVPLGRYESDGDHSGEVFRKKHLLPEIQRAIKGNDIVEVDLDGLDMLSSSFSEEAFGGLVREDGLSAGVLRNTLRFAPRASHFDPYIENIWEYIRKAEEE